jgi:hypothetical protein
VPICKSAKLPLQMFLTPLSTIIVYTKPYATDALLSFPKVFWFLSILLSPLRFLSGFQCPLFLCSLKIDIKYHIFVRSCLMLLAQNVLRRYGLVDLLLFVDRELARAAVDQQEKTTAVDR